jgi:hypothetical protein
LILTPDDEDAPVTVLLTSPTFAPGGRRQLFDLIEGAARI